LALWKAGFVKNGLLTYFFNRTGRKIFKKIAIFAISSTTEHFLPKKEMDKYKLYSVGHSNMSEEEFLELLKTHGIDCIVDVRSVPASKYTPQFNLEPLKWFLKSNGIQYLHFGDEFGARRSDSFDAEGQVDFEKAIETQNFKKGVNRLTKGLEKGFRISLMCSEANPLECHRFSLVSRYFHDNGLDVWHIMKDAETVSHKDLEEEMIKSYLHSKRHLLPEIDQLLGTYTKEDQRRDAYRLKNKEIGYKKQLELEELENLMWSY